jgi:hypothetical protein
MFLGHLFFIGIHQHPFRIHRSRQAADNRHRHPSRRLGISFQETYLW